MDTQRTPKTAKDTHHNTKQGKTQQEQGRKVTPLGEEMYEKRG